MTDLNIVKQIQKKLKLNKDYFIERVKIKLGGQGYSLNHKKQITGLALDLAEYKVKNLEYIFPQLKDLRNSLTELSIWRCQFHDISLLKNFKSLKVLSLYNIHVSDISPLKDLKKLKSLYLDGNEIRDISSLKKLINLNELSLKENNISDISPLKDLKKLKSLCLVKNKIIDVSSLKELKKLTDLNLKENNISDTSPLDDLLDTIDIKVDDKETCNIEQIQYNLNEEVSKKNKYNPFKPNHPVQTGMFAGRKKEIRKISKYLFQTKKSSPTHILIKGELGIGKTSLLLFANHLAKGELEFNEDKYNFLTMKFNLTPKSTPTQFLKKFVTCLKCELSINEKKLTFLKEVIEFIKNIEAAGIKYDSKNFNLDNELIREKTILFLADTVKAITEDTIFSDLGLRNKKDGLVILLDEVDNASNNIDLGSFLKELSEKLVQNHINKVLFILSGLPKMVDILRESHKSSLRLFDQIELQTLSQKEVSLIIKKGLKDAKIHGSDVSIKKEALQDIYHNSDGYPHFVQQMGYSSFEVDSDNNIDSKDVSKAMDEAIELIGNRYYEDIYYECSKVDSYKQILDIMADIIAEKHNKSVNEKKIKAKFKGKVATFKDGIKALQDRNIIFSEKDKIGIYRFKWITFTDWINKINKKNIEM